MPPPSPLILKVFLSESSGKLLCSITRYFIPLSDRENIRYNHPNPFRQAEKVVHKLIGEIVMLIHPPEYEDVFVVI